MPAIAERGADSRSGVRTARPGGMETAVLGGVADAANRRTDADAARALRNAAVGTMPNVFHSHQKAVVTSRRAVGAADQC